MDALSSKNLVIEALAIEVKPIEALAASNLEIECLEID